MNSPVGVGYLVHNSQRYARFIEALGPQCVDVYEVLFIQFANALHDARRILQYGKPTVMHSAALSIAGSRNVAEKNISRVNAVAEAFDVRFVSDHMCFTGDGERTAEALLPPIFSEEQADLIADNLAYVQPRLSRPLILENVVRHYAVGHLSQGQFFNAVLDRTNVDVVVSLENITQSNETYAEVSHKEFIASLPRERVAQIHCTFQNRAESERSASLAKRRAHHHHLLEWMAQEGFRPSTVIFELETATPSLPEVGELREEIAWARELFFGSARPLDHAQLVSA
jgi:uncharacterized protein (UPF0276 family)